jgi:hypothetical protein
MEVPLFWVELGKFSHVPSPVVYTVLYNTCTRPSTV